MAGGVNPFGFSGGVIPARRAPRQPQDLPSAPFGFAPPPSKMQQTLAILNEYNPLPAFERLMKSPMALGGPISEQDIADGLMVAGTVTGGSAAAPKPRNALNMGIRAYHGSPHDFDRFDMSKIGTGEGAQAYGHGLYFAENEGVARGYRDALTNKAVPQGKHIEKVAFNIVRNAPDRPDSELAPFVRNVYPDATDAEVADALRVARANQQSGRMYEVTINADPDTFLDWDKPLSEQPEAVRSALKKLDIATGSMSAKDRVETLEAAMSGDPRLAHLLKQGGINVTGDTVYRGLSDSLGAVDWPVTADAATRAQFRSKGAAGATDALKQAGIPGIKYLDAGSRGAGDGTRNYVVFDDKLISIVKKYGIAGASAMLGYNILDGMDPAQAEELQRIEGNQ